MSEKCVCLFAGARGNSYLFNDAKWLCTGLVKTGWSVIYGGSSRGVMGACCAAVKEAGGKITGVLPRKVYELNHYDPEIETLVAETMASRKEVFWSKSDAFIALPGAYGTLDEIGELLTLTKLGYMAPKPFVVFNQNGFYSPLKALFQNMTDHGFMGADRANLVKFCDTPWQVLEVLNASQ